MTIVDPPAALPPLGDPAIVGRTRDSWHAVAEHVLAAARHRETGRIGLIVTGDGFGVPRLPSGTIARVEGATLVVERGGASATVELTTIAAAARALGIDPGAPTEVYAPTTSTPFDAPLVVDRGAAVTLSAWYRLGWSVLDVMQEHAPDADGASGPTLWPEHFDAAIDLGDEDRGARGTFGISPGDTGHAEPYLYVTSWADVPTNAYWNDAVFPGASLGYSSVASSRDPVATTTHFFERGREILTGGT